MGSLVRRSVAVVFALGLVGAACSSSSDDTTTTAAVTTTTPAVTTTAPATSTSIATTTTTESSGAVSGLKEVRSAVVRIVAEGSFIDPEYGEISNAGGSGSGFIIDPSGIAVTNNHVVTGAAFLQVFVEGEDEPRNAKILGVSECSDLAVIDIDGTGFPYVDWYEGDIAVGDEVYAAGYPGGDPEYTLTEGIISKERADGETYWASVDSIIEHTAQVLQGNSGGPLVTPEGQVVGVNYRLRLDGTQQWAISRDEVAKILPELVAGNNVTSIGVNGTAFTADEYSGMWVAAVESGSPAANVGIKGGDIIAELEGLVLATDGTMSDYCDILRSHEATDPLAIEILRFDTEEVLEGTLNGDEELTLAFSFAEELGEDVGSDEVVSYEYVQVWDDYDLLVMQIPTEWVDITGAGWVIEDSDVGYGITAAPNIGAYFDTWDTPGVFFGATEIPPEGVQFGQYLDYYQYNNTCTFDGSYEYADPLYSGAYEVWTDCGGSETAIVNVEAYPESEDFVVFVQVQVVTDADLEALDVILSTFEVVID